MSYRPFLRGNVKDFSVVLGHNGGNTVGFIGVMMAMSLYILCVVSLSLTMLTT